MLTKEELIAKATLGDHEAQYQLGLYYYQNHKEKEAIFWIKTSADLGNPRAKVFLTEIKNKK